jgi:two-component sensor histidine kinase
MSKIRHVDLDQGVYQWRRYAGIADGTRDRTMHTQGGQSDYQLNPRSAPNAAFNLPLNCPRSHCAAITSGQVEIKRLQCAEAELKDALLREQLLLEGKDEFLRQKELLSRESDHRLLNGLQMVASLLSVQSRQAKEPEAAAQLKHAAGRVITVARVHRRLHVLDHIDAVELLEYLNGLCEEISGMFAIEGSTNVIVVQGISITVPTTIGIPLAFVVSELVTNSAKYAGGKITVNLANTSAGSYALSVSDEGPGLPEDFDPQRTRGLGMLIVSTLLKDMGGALVCGTNDSGKGARFTVLFDAVDIRP